MQADINQKANAACLNSSVTFFFFNNMTKGLKRSKKCWVLWGKAPSRLNRSRNSRISSSMPLEILGRNDRDVFRTNRNRLAKKGKAKKSFSLSNHQQHITKTNSFIRYFIILCTFYHPLHFHYLDNIPCHVGVKNM